MNLVQTMPELKEARLNGLKGVGYAEVVLTPGQIVECRGVIVFDAGEDVAGIAVDEALFEGVVYRDGEEFRERMSVEVVFFDDNQNQEPGATFIAKR